MDKLVELLANILLVAFVIGWLIYAACEIGLIMSWDDRTAIYAAKTENRTVSRQERKAYYDAHIAMCNKCEQRVPLVKK